MIVGADPEGSVLSGDTARPYLTEGVGEDFLPGTYDPNVVDRWVRVSDRDAFADGPPASPARRASSPASRAAPRWSPRSTVARELIDAGEGARTVIVVLLPDSGRNYLSKLYNDEWMRVNGLLPTTGAVVRVADLLADRHHAADRPAVVVARTTERVGTAIERLQEYGISQMPVSEDPRATRSRASSARSTRRACSTAPSATRRSSSGRSAR